MCILEKQINSYFIKNEKPERICQDDLLQNITYTQDRINLENTNELISRVINFPYVLVMSQDCDLKQFFDRQKERQENEVFNQYIPNVIIVPLYMRDDFKNGENLKFLKITQNKKSSDTMKLIEQEREPRYHYIEPDSLLSIPELFIDFKVYYTIPPNELFSVYKKSYVATINALFRERIVQRYTNYISRIGLPVLTNNQE